MSYRDSDAWKKGRATAEAAHEKALGEARVRLAELEAMTEGEIFRAGAHTEINRLRHLLGINDG